MEAHTKKSFIIIVLLLALFSSSLKAEPQTRWTFTTAGSVYSSPVFYNGAIFIGSDDGNLYCLDAGSGEKIWDFKTGGIIRCKPAVGKDAVYFSSDDGNLYSVNAKSGKLIWKFNIGNNIKRVLPVPSAVRGNYWDYMQSSPCVNNNVVYVGSGDSCLYAVSASTGKLKWKARTGGLVRSSPCIYGGNVYVGSWDGFIYSFNMDNGSKEWSFDCSGTQYKNVQPSPVISNGVLYCGSRNPYFYALDAKTGKELWKHSFDFSWVESSADVHKNVVYVGSSDLRTIHAFNAENGKVIWESKVDGTTWSSPYFYNGKIYIGLASYTNSFDIKTGGAILALDASSGKLKWQLDCGKTPYIGGVVSSPLVKHDVVYYGSLDSKVYAVEIPAKENSSN